METSSLGTTLTYRGSDQGGGVGGINYSEFSDGTDLNYKFYNLRGDVIMTIDANDVRKSKYLYFGFGNNELERGSEIATDKHRANTKVEDENNLLNEGKRFRSLELGIFLTPDPLEYVDGPNPYIYCNQNPWGRWDPEGLNEAKFWTQEEKNSCGPAALVNFQIAYGLPSDGKFHDEKSIKSDISKMFFPSGNKQKNFLSNGISFHYINRWLKNNYPDLVFRKKELPIKEIAKIVNKNHIPAFIITTSEPDEDFKTQKHLQLLIPSDKKNNKTIILVDTYYQENRHEQISAIEMKFSEFEKMERKAREDSLSNNTSKIIIKVLFGELKEKAKKGKEEDKE